jgi:N-acetylneuraminic acid mutarotase
MQAGFQKTLFWITIVLVTLSSCKKDDALSPPVTITSFTPALGQVGATVTITGTNFSTTPENNVVQFNGVEAAVKAATTTQLIVLVPVGATTGQITVTTNGITAKSANDFTVLPPPLAITSFSPAKGKVGSTVTITGTSFSATASNNTALFGTLAATVTAATSTQLTVTVPVGAVDGKISVAVSGTTVQSATDFIVSDRWQKMADFGGAPRSSTLFAFTINGKAYLGANGVIDFWEYDPATNSWTQKADFSGPGRSLANGFSIGSKGYFGMGRDPSTGASFSDFWEYNPATNSWSQKKDFVGISRQSAVAFSIGAKGYLGLGRELNINKYINFTDFWEYDPTNDSWVKKADFIGAGRTSSFSLAIGAKGYVGGGFAGSIGNSSFYEYDPSANQWAQKSNVPVPGIASSFSINSKGYAGGPQSNFWEFDPTTNTWSKKANLPNEVSDGIGFAIGNYGYIGIGGDGVTGLNKNFYRYTPE